MRIHEIELSMLRRVATNHMHVVGYVSRAKSPEIPRNLFGGRGGVWWVG